MQDMLCNFLFTSLFLHSSSLNLGSVLICLHSSLKIPSNSMYYQKRIDETVSCCSIQLVLTRLFKARAPEDLKENRALELHIHFPVTDLVACIIIRTK